MTRPQASALVHSIQARLKNAAREGGRPFAELLELYAVDSCRPDEVLIAIGACDNGRAHPRIADR